MEKIEEKYDITINYFNQQKAKERISLFCSTVLLIGSVSALGYEINLVSKDAQSKNTIVEFEESDEVLKELFIVTDNRTNKSTVCTRKTIEENIYGYFDKNGDMICTSNTSGYLVKRATSMFTGNGIIDNNYDFFSENDYNVTVDELEEEIEREKKNER